MRAIAVSVALLVSGCGWIGGEVSTRDLCKGASDADVRAALGVGEGEPVAFNLTGGACTWTVKGANGLPKELRAEVQRESDLRRALPPRTGGVVFEEALKALERDYPRTRVLGGLGDVAVIGFGAIGDERFAGGLVARKNGDVLSLRVEGEDPAAFEAVARSIAERM